MPTTMQLSLDKEVVSYLRDRVSPKVRAGDVYGKTLSVDVDQRTIYGVISNETVDRDKEVVVARGLDFVQFKENPVVLFMHDPYSPIGKCNDGPKLRRRKGITEVIAQTKFADTTLAVEVFKLVTDEVLRGISIGMVPSSMQRRPPAPGEIRKKPEWADARAIIMKAEVCEYSFVSIPANADALTTAVNKGWVKETEPYLERFIRAVRDGSPRKRFVRVIQRSVKKVDAPQKAHVAVLSNPERDWRIKRALEAGRL